ncbi:hypothetical protein QAD02_020786 [Eretmocerus hayati]|uniref:Uncharacterized protein n=1 Tax=Eretmocerus hayati TaxID=131215 RepID=A0ACC2PPE9_9HYME|nr:hypothetical protein QAD02_020786 [Eretmocerus hayati]
MNEMVDIEAKSVQNRNLDEIRLNDIFAELMDRAIDISEQEEESICFRSVDGNFNVEKFSIAFVNAPNTKSDTLPGILNDVVEEAFSNFRRIRGQCYDGAPDVSERLVKPSYLFSVMHIVRIFVCKMRSETMQKSDI